MIICTWSTLHLSIPTRRLTPTRRLFFQVFWMAIALLAPEFLLLLALGERADATSLVKAAQKSHPHLVEPGMLSRVYKYIRAKLNGVSVSYQASNN